MKLVNITKIICIANIIGWAVYTIYSIRFKKHIALILFNPKVKQMDIYIHKKKANINTLQKEFDNSNNYIFHHILSTLSSILCIYRLNNLSTYQPIKITKYPRCVIFNGVLFLMLPIRELIRLIPVNTVARKIAGNTILGILCFNLGIYLYYSWSNFNNRWLEKIHTIVYSYYLINYTIQRLKKAKLRSRDENENYNASCNIASETSSTQQVSAKSCADACSNSCPDNSGSCGVGANCVCCTGGAKLQAGFDCLGLHIGTDKCCECDTAKCCVCGVGVEAVLTITAPLENNNLLDILQNNEQLAKHLDKFIKDDEIDNKILSEIEKLGGTINFDNGGTITTTISQGVGGQIAIYPNWKDKQGWTYKGGGFDVGAIFKVGTLIRVGENETENKKCIEIAVSDVSIRIEYPESETNMT